MIRRLGPLALAALMLAVPASAQRHGGGDFGGQQRSGPPPVYSDPGDVVAAESAFARMVREKGQWTAFRATAAPGAQFFAPQAVRVDEWLKGKPNPPAGLKWTPHALWMSCDGAYAVSHGSWANGAQHGWFATVWQRQRDGLFKWVLDQGGDTARPLAEPEMITARIADCPARRPGGRGGAGRRPVGIQVEPFDRAHPTDFTSHSAPDGSLSWATSYASDPTSGTERHFTIKLKIDGEMHDVFAISNKAGD